MNLLYPLGLIGLIGVPILIIIYIIKNKYTERTVSSTYIWTLSERFLKRKNPINKIQNLISLILQILTVVCIALAIAHPTLITKGQADDYCFILDASASMTAVSDGESRFEKAKSRIESIISESENGSAFTLIYAGEPSAVIYRDITDKEFAIKRLSETEISGTQGDTESALSYAQAYFDEIPSSKVYLLTDCDYKNYGNVEIVNVSANEVNYAIIDAGARITTSGLVVTGKVVAYGGDGEVTVSVYVNDGQNNDGKTPIGSQKVSVTKSDKLNVSLTEDKVADTVIASGNDFSIVCDSIDKYQSVKIVIENEDAVSADNEIVLYNIKHDTSFKTLIVSNSSSTAEQPSFFIESTLSALGYNQITGITIAEYEAGLAQDENTYNYGLYIFDSCTPSKMPKNGAVWFFAPDNVGNIINLGDKKGDVLGYSKSSKSGTKKLLSGLDKSEEIYISEYYTYGNLGFLEVLTCGSDPVVLAGSNEYGNREVIFAFSLNNSDLPLTFNGLQLFNNLWGYTFPQIVEESNYFCGDTVNINIISNTESLKVVSPSGKEEYISTDVSEYAYELTEVGLYTVVVRTGKGNDATERSLCVYSEMPYSESATIAEAESFTIIGTAVDGGRDGIYDNLLILIIILAVIFLADWMVYCYEQYQLR